MLSPIQIKRADYGAVHAAAGLNSWDLTVANAEAFRLSISRGANRISFVLNAANLREAGLLKDSPLATFNAIHEFLRSDGFNAKGGLGLRIQQRLNDLDAKLDYFNGEVAKTIDRPETQRPAVRQLRSVQGDHPKPSILPAGSSPAFQAHTAAVAARPFANVERIDSALERVRHRLASAFERCRDGVFAMFSRVNSRPVVAGVALGVAAVAASEIDPSKLVSELGNRVPSPNSGGALVKKSSGTIEVTPSTLSTDGSIANGSSNFFVTVASLPAPDRSGNIMNVATNNAGDVGIKQSCCTPLPGFVVADAASGTAPAAEQPTASLAPANYLTAVTAVKAAPERAANYSVNGELIGGAALSGSDLNRLTGFGSYSLDLEREGLGSSGKWGVGIASAGAAIGESPTREECGLHYRLCDQRGEINDGNVFSYKYRNRTERHDPLMLGDIGLQLTREIGERWEAFIEAGGVYSWQLEGLGNDLRIRPAFGGGLRYDTLHASGAGTRVEGKVMATTDSEAYGRLSVDHRFAFADKRFGVGASATALSGESFSFSRPSFIAEGHVTCRVTSWLDLQVGGGYGEVGGAHMFPDAPSRPPGLDERFDVHSIRAPDFCKERNGAPFVQAGFRIPLDRIFRSGRK